jgi:hydrogenase maturation protein HypF
MGRLFDVVASLLGVRHRVSYEAQAAIELEALAASAVDDRASRWAFAIDDALLIDPAPVVTGLMTAFADGDAVPDLALQFHRAVAGLVVDVAGRLRAASGAMPVALTGGVFQNALLARLARVGLEAEGFEVLTHRLVPPNDGGLSLGQAVVAGFGRR